MIDVHCHILPGVDDGPKTLEDSLEMIKIAYEDNITDIIATPHINHPFQFPGEENSNNQFQLLKEKARKLYPDITIHLGSEIYIMPSFLIDIKENLTALSDSAYILIEFARETLGTAILDAVHELKLKGYRPVVAHIEMYSDVVARPDIVKEIRKSGGYIQITASSLLGKHGKEISGFIKTLLADKDIDFIASDGHSASSRRPVLSHAYDYIEDKYSKEEADRLFVTNPKHILDNKELAIHVIEKEQKKKNKLLFPVIAAVLALGILSLGMTNQFNSADARELIKAEENKSESLSHNSEDILEQESKDENLDTKNLQSEDETSLISADVNETSESSQDISKNSGSSNVSAKYRSQLESLQSQTEGQLASLVQEIDYIKNTTSDEVERKSKIDAKLDEIGNLENKTENKVYSILYDMQNELEKEGLDVSEVQTLRDEYHQIKSQRTDKYISQLKN